MIGNHNQRLFPPLPMAARLLAGETMEYAEVILDTLESDGDSHTPPIQAYAVRHLGAIVQRQERLLRRLRGENGSNRPDPRWDIENVGGLILD